MGNQPNPFVLSDIYFGGFTKRAHYQTHVQNLSIDSDISRMRYWSWSNGSGAGGSAVSNKSWLMGKPETACTPVVCGLPFGSQLPRPPMN